MMRWSDLLIDLDPEMVWVVTSTIVAVLLPVILLLFTRRRHGPDVKHDGARGTAVEPSPRKVRQILNVWIAITVFELLCFGNLPLLSFVGIGKYVAYTDYGFSGLHGLANAIQLTLCLYYFDRYLISNERKYLLAIALLLCFSIALVSRAMFIMQIAQMLFLYLYQCKVNLKRIFYLQVAFILIVFIVDILGTAKTEGGYDISGLAQMNERYPSWLPDGFIWIYLYVVTPLNNVGNSLAYLTPTYWPQANMIDLLPNVLKNAIGFDSSSFVVLVDENLNVSSYLESFLSDFGVFTFFVLFIIFFFFAINWIRSGNDRKRQLINSVFCSIALLSFFVNTFAMLILFFQLALINYVHRLPKYRSTRN
jgi:oligosaccharide repeat unit polymerase